MAVWRFLGGFWLKFEAMHLGIDVLYIIWQQNLSTDFLRGLYVVPRPSVRRYLK